MTNAMSTKERIFEAIRTLLRTETMESISLRKVAKAAGITVPSMYHYFDNKQEMLAAAQEFEDAEISQILKTKLPSALSPDLKLITLTINVAQYCFEHKRSLWQALVARETTGPMASILDALREYLRQVTAVRQGTKENLEHTLYRFVAAMTAEIEWLYKINAPELPKQFAEDLFDSFFIKSK